MPVEVGGGLREDAHIEELLKAGVSRAILGTRAFQQPEALEGLAARFGDRLAAPAEPWERLKIAAGTPPVRTRHGWLMLYHGVSEADGAADGGAAVPPVGGGKRVRYSAGLLVLAEDDPTRILYRSKSPVFAPETPHERDGLVANVVFPTGIDRRDDLGTPDRLDVYYGMADSRIGVARLVAGQRKRVGGGVGHPWVRSINGWRSRGWRSLEWVVRRARLQPEWWRARARLLPGLPAR